MGEKQRWIGHYSSSHKILLVGEGDFSFSACLARAFRSATKMVATTLESEDTLLKEHWSSEAHVDELQRRGCLVLHEVDVYDMDQHPTLMFVKFDIIVFNFPHAGHDYWLCERNNELIRRHRGLLEAFFRSASGMLGEGGEIHVSHRDDYPYDKWKLKELAKKAGLVLKEKVWFEKSDYPGYHQKRGGGIQSNKTFPLKECYTFKFSLKHETSVLDSEEATSKLQRKLEELHLPQHKTLIRPNHIHVPESEGTNFKIGAADFVSGPETDKSSHIMSGCGFRVSISNSVRKTIQDIKEITGNHSEEEIYAMLKRCYMDPNETAQKLLYQDPFHEVKGKRDKRKENLNNIESAESPWRPGMQGREGESGWVNFSPRYMSHDAGDGGNSAPRVAPSLPISRKTKNKQRSLVTSSRPIIVASNKVDEIMDISLDVFHSNSVKDALQRFFQPELLDGQNKYKCESCNKLVAARKQMSILQAPNVLVIQLKRFEGIFGGKIDKSISFEDVLVLSSFMCKASQDLRPEYKLFGTIVHSGFSPESGHYYAYIKDAMGRWYRCNDSFVSLSTLQEVLSEKVYILFFSRTNQRPAASTASNGVSSRDCNGRETSQSPKPALPPKGAQTKTYEQSSWKDISAISKVDKAPSSPRMKFNISGNSSSKRAPATNNGKFACKNQSLGSNGERAPGTDNGKVAHKNQSLGSNGERPRTTDNGKIAYKDEAFRSDGERTPATDNGKIAHKNLSLGSNGERAPATDNGKIAYENQSIGLNGDVKDPVSLEKREKAKTSLINKDGLHRDKKSDIIGGNSSKASLLSRENGGTGSVKTELCEGIGARDRLTAGEVPDHSELDNSGLHGHSGVSGPKRKSQDSCILFARDDQSRAEVEGLKEILKKEASSVLRSCGWSDKVHSFMRSKKRLCAQQVGTDLNSDEVKKLLIVDSKSAFLSQIPESLRADLVNRIRSFSQK